MPSEARNSHARSTSTKFDQSHDTILKAAACLFRDKGYAGSTLRDIASAVGMKAGSIYYHFDSKEEILDAILDQGVREIYSGVQAAIQSSEGQSDHRKTITVAIHTHLQLILAQSEFTSANIRIFSQLPAEIRERHRPLRLAYVELWETLLRDAQNAGQLRKDIEIVSLRQFVLGALNWTVEWFDKDRDSIDELAACYADLILHGVSVKASRAKKT